MAAQLFSDEGDQSFNYELKGPDVDAENIGKAVGKRLLKLAEKFHLPLISFVDTAGAFPGEDAEERGQSESIASSILYFLKTKVPTISIIIGEGG